MLLGGEWITRRRTITQADVIAFVGLSGDFNPLYMDAEHARSGPYGEPVVPGPLVAAVAAGLGAIDVPVPATVGMVGMTWRFLRPVRPGDTIGSRWRLNRKRPVDNPRWGLAVWQVDVENQRGEIVATAEVTRLVSRREQPAEPARPGKGRRRRRRAAAEAAVNNDLPPKPIPGPLVEAAGRLPAEPQRAALEVASPVPEAPSRRRRRSGGRPKPEAEVEVEPAPSEPVVTTAAGPTEADASPTAPTTRDEPAPSEPPATPAPPARRRRRRSSAEQVELALNALRAGEESHHDSC